jgi:hypothetical protein
MTLALHPLIRAGRTEWRRVDGRLIKPTWLTTVVPSLSTTILLPCLPRLRGVAQESLRWGLLQMITLE